MGWLGIIGFICLGAFIGFFINGLNKAKGTLLQQNFIKLGNLVGLSLEEIKNKVGEPSSMSACTTEKGTPGSLYQWAEYPYSITLVFDENLVCLGVNQEVTAK
ncbi:hypothetical protein [Bacteroides thetaiotaomicron]|uniref:hypothetical protein n=1 Tax=Bacteroides thetaiotaomicron TaxID=818 RepID=UPI00356796AE